MDRLKGFELLYALIKDQLRSKQDCLVAAVHSLMINEGLVCLGVGDDNQASNDTGTELLPDGWNDNQEVYSLVYADRQFVSRYLLKIVTAENTLIVNVLKDEENVAALTAQIENHVSDDYKVFSSAFMELGQIVNAFETEIFDKLKKKVEEPEPACFSSVGGISGCNPGSNPTFDDNFDDFDDDLEHPSHFMRPPGNPRARRRSSPDGGGADLDPFSGGRGGGMIVDPGSLGSTRPTLPQFGIGSPGGLPRAAVPAGARFYPTRPPSRGRGGRTSLEPDPDHLAPPNRNRYDDI